VTVTDFSGCTASCCFTVSQPTALSVSCSGTNVSCNGGNNGSACSTVSGGTAPYTYHWASGATSTCITNLTAGTYCITITDSHACTTSCCYSVSQPAALSASCGGTNVACNGGNNGSACTTASGGTLPYSYHWASG